MVARKISWRLGYLSSIFFILYVLLVCCGPVLAQSKTSAIELTPQERQWLNEHPTILLGVPDGVPGLCKTNDQGEVEGFFIDYIRLLEQRAGFKFTFDVRDYTKFLDPQTHQAMDVMLSSRLSQSNDEYLYTQTIYQIPFVIITRNDAPFISGRHWLAGKKVAALKNFATEKLLKEDKLGIDVIPVDSVRDGVYAVSFGQADAFVGGMLLASQIITDHQISNLKIASQSGYPDFQASLRIRKDWPELQQIIDKAIDSISPLERDRLLHYWMVSSVHTHTDWRSIGRWGGMLGGLLALMLMASVFWNRQLKSQVALRTHELEVSTQTLKQSEERYRSTFEHAAVGMVHTSLAGIILRANKRFGEMLGYEPEQLLGMHFKDVTYPDDLKKSENYYKELIDGISECCYAEKRYYRKDHRVVWCHLSTTLLKDDQGKPVHFINVIKDITEQYNTQIQLQQSNQQLQDVMDASILAMIITTDRNGVITLFNSGAQRLLGYTPQEVIGKHTPMLFHTQENIQAKADELHKKLGYRVEGFEIFVTQTQADGYEERHWTLVRKDGKHVEVILGVTCIRDDSGQITGFLGVGQDVTEHVKAKEELAQKEENLRITLNSIGDAVIATDSDGNIVQMNPIAEKLTGWSIDEARNQPLVDVFHIINAKTREIMPNPVEKVIESGEIVGLANHTVLISKDKTEYQIADSGAPIRNDDGKIIGVVLVFRDVTTEYAMQHRLRETEKMQAIGQLAGGIAHDFNNMLGGILGSAEMLEERIPHDRDSRELFEIIMQSAQRAAALTNKLLTFSRRQPPQTTVIDVHQLLADTVTILKQTIDRRIDISCDFAAETKLIQGDVSQLQNAFLNLGINASHAMANGGKIIINTKIIHLTPDPNSKNTFDLKAGKYIQIDVHDTGYGIAPEHLGHIFEPFFTTKEQGKGTGLGLATVFSTVKQHNGSIAASSKLNKGTCFTICLPLAKKEITDEPKAEKTQRVGGHGHILIVDDEKVMRITAKAILEDLGYQVSLAEDGQIALDLFSENPDNYDLVVLDMMMPNLNGKDCFLAMKQIRPEIKVILSTGYTPESELLAMKAAGLTAWIKKPYMSGPLSQKIQEVLEQTG